MNKKEKAHIIDNILKTCLFSEYLPTEFTSSDLNKNVFTIKIKNSNIAPVVFTMDKFNDFGNRRYISIPEIGSYIEAVNSLTSNNILEKILKVNREDRNSLSKIMNDKKEIKRFSDGYGFKIINKQEISEVEMDDDFINNLNIKMEMAKACESILHLDISNFYNSIYTHYISSITKGEEWAQKQYFLRQKDKDKVTQEYKDLKNIDDKIIAMNLKRTHGLLTGPKLSFIIAESLLSQIDNELRRELSNIDVQFVRYVDDYDVFIKDNRKLKDVELIFNNVLQKYGLLINDSKTKIEAFPYYTYIDYNSIKNDDLGNSYAVFGQIEKSKRQNGALLFFSQNILAKDMSSKLSVALSFSILRNISKALMTCCKNIANYNKTRSDQEIYNLLDSILKEFSHKQFDLECIWILYTILKLYPAYELDKSLINNLNEVALILYLYESNTGINNTLLIEKAKCSGWLLNYELYFNGKINKDDLKNNLNVMDTTVFDFLKSENINFYHKVG